MKVFGKELAGGCIWVTRSGGTVDSSGSDEDIEVQAFLVKAGIGRHNLLVDGSDIRSNRL